MQSLIILGRQPALGLAELESLYGTSKLQPVGSQAVAIDVAPQDINFARLGGMVKFAKVLTVLDTTNWGDIQKISRINRSSAPRLFTGGQAAARPQQL